MGFLTGAWALIKLVPWQIYVGIALVLGVWGYGLHQKSLGKDIGYTNGVAEWKPRYDALKVVMESWKAQAESERKRRESEAEAFKAQLAAERLAFEQKLAAERALRKQEVADAKSRIPEFITVQARARCDLPVGLVLYHNGVVEAANRGERFATVPPASADLAGSSSGASLDSMSEVFADNAAAYRECKSRVTDILGRWDRAAESYEALKARLTTTKEEKP